MKTSARRFKSAVLRLEKRTLAELRAAYDEARGRMTDRLFNNWMKSSLVSTIDSEFDRMRRMTASLGRGLGEELEAIVLDYGEAQIGEHRLGVSTSRARAESADRRYAIIAALLATSSNWVDVQRARMLSETAQLEAMNADTELAYNRLFGERLEDGRASVWRQGLVTMQLDEGRSLWTAANTMAGAYYVGVAKLAGALIKKQAVAVMDSKTTECCQNVHGQIRLLVEPFDLYGSPRFASQMMWPPFHWNCRTVATMIAGEDLSETTEDQQRAARQALLDQQWARDHL